MKRLIRKIVITIIVLMISFNNISFVNAESNKKIQNDSDFIISKDMSKYESDGIIYLDIELKNINKKIIYFDTYLEYDKTIFNTINKRDIEILVDEDFISYFYVSNTENEKDKIGIEFTEDIEITKLFRVKITKAENIGDIESGKMAIKNSSYYSFDIDEEGNFEDVEIDLIKTENIDPNNPEDSDLYLSTEKYKIGENDTKEYEKEDKYLYRVDRNTTRKEFIEELNTNGEMISILKFDNTELEDDENVFVGTGMKLIISKGSQKIELIISVIGDLSGDGQISIEDLGEINRRILSRTEKSMSEENILAADIDENGEITILDLREVNYVILTEKNNEKHEENTEEKDEEKIEVNDEEESEIIDNETSDITENETEENIEENDELESEKTDTETSDTDLNENENT